MESRGLDDFRYYYRGAVTKVVDGDTVYADIDTGFGIYKANEKFRLYGINAPEKNDPLPENREKAKQAAAYVASKLTGDSVVSLIFHTYKDATEKYGRFLATVYYADGAGGWKNINKELLEQGLAVGYLPRELII